MDLIEPQLYPHPPPVLILGLYCIVLRQAAQACSNGRIDVFFYSISILTFARLGLKSNRTQAQSDHRRSSRSKEK
jgi:hypothetical protein